MRNIQKEDTDSVYCRNCSCDLTDPTSCGFKFDGDWYCSPMCAEVCSGFWTRGFELEEGNSKNGAVIEV